MRNPSLKFGCLFLTLLVASPGSRMQGATVTWDGGSGGNAFWDTAGNWDIAGTPASTDDVVFGTGFTSGTTIGLNGNRTANSLTIDTSIGLSIANNTLTLISGSLTRNSTTSGDQTLASGVSLGANALWTIDGSGTLTVSGAIGDGGATSFSLTKAGSGRLILTGNNTYDGDTIVSAGTLQVDGTGIPHSAGDGNVIVNGSGTLDLFDATVAINGLSGSGLIQKTAGATADTFTIGGNGVGGNFSGIITQTGVGVGYLNVIKTGIGTQTLSGNSGYNGTTVIENGGALNIQHANALGTTTGGTMVNSGGALQIQGGITTAAEALTLNGTGVATDGALRNISANNTYAGTITLGSASRINSDADTLTISGGINGAGNALTVGGAGNVTIITTGLIGTGTSLTKDGTATLSLSVASTYTGGTTLSGGTLQLGADNVIPDSGTFTFAGGILDANDRTDTIGALSLSGNSSLVLHNNATQGILTFDSAAYSSGTLIIYGWQGTAGGPNTANGDQLLINTPSQSFLDNLQHVQFDLGGQLYFGTMIGNELMPGLTAVPEPINVALCVFGGMFATLGFVRRFRAHRSA